MSLSYESLGRVLELACIDLIQRNRRGEIARVEEYLQQHPALSDPAYLLDLVDAEICVRKELGERVRVDDWSRRFPHQTQAIQQLISLEGSVKELVGGGSLLTPEFVSASSEHLRSNVSNSLLTVDSLTSDSSTSISEALTVAGSDALSENLPGGTPPLKSSLFPAPPINPPLGFVVDSGVSTRPGVWLLRCHEESAQQPCCFKVIDVARSKSGQLTSLESNAILDACERAAKIRHPVWVQPLVATCDGRFLGIIRPWIFGVSWREGIGGLTSDEAFRFLAELAFGLHAAHQSGCHHGNVCENNLFFSHEGKLRLTDPVNMFSQLVSSSNVSPHDLVREDAMMFCRLISSLQLDLSRGLSNQLVAHCHSLVLDTPTDTMAIVGEWLIRIADDISRISPSSTPNEQQSVVSWLKSIFVRRKCDDLKPIDATSY